ncbi:hypothetical protein Csa_023543, partial [Cucumis sativus]
IGGSRSFQIPIGVGTEAPSPVGNALWPFPPSPVTSTIATSSSDQNRTSNKPFIISYLRYFSLIQYCLVNAAISKQSRFRGYKSTTSFD